MGVRACGRTGANTGAPSSRLHRPAPIDSRSKVELTLVHGSPIPLKEKTHKSSVSSIDLYRSHRMGLPLAGRPAIDRIKSEGPANPSFYPPNPSRRRSRPFFGRHPGTLTHPASVTRRRKVAWASSLCWTSTTEDLLKRLEMGTFRMGAIGASKTGWKTFYITLRTVKRCSNPPTPTTG